MIDRAIEELQTKSAEPLVLSAPDAMAAILVASVSVDGSLSVDEAARIEGILSTSRVLRSVSAAAGTRSVERALTLLNEHGLAAVLTACADALPPELHAAAFAVAMDLVLADGHVDAREKAYIDNLQATLGVDNATALKIAEVLVIKNRA